jgi:hypothetical protein
MSTRACARIGAALLALLGLARGLGGAFMLHGGARTAGANLRTDAPVGWIGAGLVLVGVLSLGAGFMALRRTRSALWVGGAVLTLFVVGGLVNGTLLYSSPRPAGVLGNFLYALLTMVMLWRGR